MSLAMVFGTLAVAFGAMLPLTMIAGSCCSA
jgi:hypothetical protein